MQSTTGRSLFWQVSREITLYEAEVMRQFSRLRRVKALTMLFRAASRLGDGVLWYLLGALLLIFGDYTARLAAASAIVAALGSVALFMVLKNAIARPRPCDVWQGVRRLMAAPDKFSFPSGHTMTAFSIATAMYRIMPGGAALLFPVAAVIGVSRVFCGLHYPTDVLAGAALGSLVGYLCGWAAHANFLV